MIRQTAAAILLAGFANALGLREDTKDVNDNGVEQRIVGHETATDNDNDQGQQNANGNSVFPGSGSNDTELNYFWDHRGRVVDTDNTIERGLNPTSVSLHADNTFDSIEELLAVLNDRVLDLEDEVAAQNGLYETCNCCGGQVKPTEGACPPGCEGVIDTTIVMKIGDWVTRNASNFKGPKGPKGPDGPRGLPGDKGIDGLDGTDG